MVYHESIDATPNAGLSMGSLGFVYENAKFRGFGLGLGFRAQNSIEDYIKFAINATYAF